LGRGVVDGLEDGFSSDFDVSGVDSDGGVLDFSLRNLGEGDAFLGEDGVEHGLESGEDDVEFSLEDWSVQETDIVNNNGG